MEISFRDHVQDDKRFSSVGRLWSVLCLYSLLVLVACGGPPAGTGDPGDRRLNQLVSDPIFATLPPEAEMTGPMERTRAQYREPGFEPAGWDGPFVRVPFASSQPPASVFTYYKAEADADGWTSNGNRNLLGYPFDWQKRFPDGWQGSLGLLDLTSRDVTPGDRHEYVLTASAPAIEASG